MMWTSTFLTYRRLVQFIWAIYAGTLFLMTHLPVPEGLEEVVSTFDKSIHAAAYFVLGILTFLAFPGQSTRRSPMPILLPGLLIYAALDEYLQGFVNRSPDVRDWMSDATGILLAWLTMTALMRWRQPAINKREARSDC